MGQCCGFVKTDKSSTINTQHNKEEQYKEIENVIKNMDEGERKNALLKELNNRSSLVISKESYQDIIDIQHKIYEGPGGNNKNKSNSNLQNLLSKEDIQLIESAGGSALDKKKSSLQNPIEQDTTQQNANNQQQQQVENQSTTNNDSKQNAISSGTKEEKKQSSKQDIQVNNDTKGKEEQEKTQKVPSKQKVDLQEPQKNTKSSKENNNSSRKPESSPTKEEKTKNSKKDPKQQQSANKDGKNVGFNIEDIDREMKKASRKQAQSEAQTDIDNETTKTEKVPKGVLKKKKYSDVQSCYTAGAADENTKKKRVKFTDPQKPKKKVAKRKYH